LLLAGSPVDAKNVSGETPLHLAAYAGNMTLAEMLIDYGADVNALNEYRETPLHYASRRSKAASVQMLLQRGCDFTLESSLGDTALDEAGDARCETHLRAYSRSQIENKGKKKDGLESRGSNRTAMAARAAKTNIFDLQQSALTRLFGFLSVSDLCKSACVCGRWHRTIEDPALWKNLGVRRWELALAASMKNVNVNNDENERGKVNIRVGGDDGDGRDGGNGGNGGASKDCLLDPFTPAPMTSLFRVGGKPKARKK